MPAPLCHDRSMETLVLGRVGAERSRLERLLREDGHTVSACHDSTWGCVGMDGGCPLDESAIDVAVAVAEPDGRFDAQGVACLYRARIPIVAVGATPSDPVLAYVNANVPHGDTSVLVAMEAAMMDASGHRSAIEVALTEHVTDEECVTVSVERRKRSIDVLLVAAAGDTRAASLADVARGAVRHYDPHVNVIDVSVVAPD